MISSSLRRDFAFLFDLDGTLFESHHQIVASVNYVRKLFGHPEASEETLVSKIGPPAYHLFEDLDLDSESIGNLVDIFRQDLKSRVASGTPLHRGVEDLLGSLHQAGYFVAIVTSKPDDLAEMMVSLSPINVFINHVQGSTGIKPKPHPEGILRALDKLGANRGVMVGDRTEDILAAVAAGISSIGVAQTSHSPAQLIAAGADYAYKSIEELSSNFESINFSTK